MPKAAGVDIGHEVEKIGEEDDKDEEEEEEVKIEISKLDKVKDLC